MSRFIVCLLLSGTLLRAEPPPLTLLLTPLVGFAPLTVRARLRLTPADVNRTLCLEWEGPGQSGLTCRPLDGQSAPHLHLLEIKALPGGTYTVRASVQRGSYWWIAPLQTITVVGLF